MIYLDSSVVLAYLLVEERSPPEALWQETVVSSRLLQYEVWNRLHAVDQRGFRPDDARAFMSRIAFVELSEHVLARALEPFPVRVRTLDGLHLASMEFLRARRQVVELATYDTRLAEAARVLGIPVGDW